MAELITQFMKSCSNVEPETGDVSHASEAHTEIRAVLEQHEDLKRYAIDTILIGSYARDVSIRRVKDVDVFSKVPGLDGALTSSDLLGIFMSALERYGDRLELQDRSIKVDFPDFGLHVDAVPARPAGEVWEIPDRPSPGTSDAWQTTNPEQLGALSTKMNTRYDKNYVPVVKLIRQTRRARLGTSRPGGLFFEILTYHAFDEMAVEMEDANRSRLYVAALRAVADKLADFRDGGEVPDPSIDDEIITVRATDAEKPAAASKIADAAARAEDALAEDEPCRAAKLFQDVLGKNDDGDWVFELPSYCNADGTPQPNITSASRAVPAGSARFG